jgi:hypothetical protein
MHSCGISLSTRLALQNILESLLRGWITGEVEKWWPEICRQVRCMFARSMGYFAQLTSILGRVSNSFSA